MIGNTWTVPGEILRVVDADTYEINLDLGWKITYRAKVRLAGINAPEIATAEGREARDWITAQLRLGSGEFRPVTVVSHSLDKYGRVLGSILWNPSGTTAVIPPLSDWRNVAEDLIDSQRAAPVR
jgi:endonuclease YncB( thermonuclease family)